MPWWIGQKPSGTPRDPFAVIWTYVQAAQPPANFSNVQGPYSTKSQALAALFLASGGQAGSPSGSGTNPNTGAPAGNTNPAGQTASAQGPSFPNPLGDIGNFFHALTQSSTWVRVGEVAVGGILLFVGVRALAQGSPVAGAQARKAVTRPARKVAGKAVKVAAPEVRLATRVAAKKAAPKTTARVAAHRAKVAQYGAKKPYSPPPPPKPRQPTERISHIYYHKGP